ncbi:MAG: YceI family protein [Pseudomonadota bacterium]
MTRFLALALCLLTSAAIDAPEAFRLDTARSSVGFTYRFMGRDTLGTMPVKSAGMAIDLRNISASRVDVTLDPTDARAGFLFATQAMKGPRVLDTARHAEITFRSTDITGTLQEARITGDLTVRGVTQPVTLQAGLYRQRGTDPADLDNLTVLLTGAIDRRAFGADGYPAYVGPKIALRIVARIER